MQIIMTQQREQGVKIPIPEGGVGIRLPDFQPTYFLEPGDTPRMFTAVYNSLGSDGATYEFTPDQLTITGHSTHKPEINGVVRTFTVKDKEFWDWQNHLQQLIDQKNNHPEEHVLAKRLSS